MAQPRLELPFNPAWWCPGRHTQTIFARYFRPVPRLKMNRKRLETPDNDFLDIDLLEGSPPEAPLVIILHGLEGSSRAPYVLSFMSEIRKRNWPAAAVNFRGCSGEANRLKQTYHSGKTEDLDFLVHYFHKSEPRRKIYLVGFSLGGNIVLKWLGEQKESARGKVHKAVAVSVPYDLVEAARLMDQGFNRQVYTRKLLSTLKAKALHKERRFAGILDRNKVKRCKTFKVFDREVTAKLNGFKDEMDYWVHSSSLHYLANIRVETLLIHAEDDPFFPGKLFPFEAAQKNAAHLNVLMTSRGGHLGFVGGATPWKQDLWLEQTMIHFLF